MFPHDRIRFHLLQARKLPEGEERRGAIAALLAEALTEARGRDGAASEETLRRRFGFTQAELDAHGAAAIDAATLAAERTGTFDLGTGR